MKGSRIKTQSGYTLIELLVTVATMSFLAMMALQQYDLLVARGRRAEARIVLKGIRDAQILYYASHDRYAGNFGELNFSLHGGGAQNSNALVGRWYTYRISQPWGSESFYVSAAATTIDLDGWPDVLILDDGAPTSL